MKASTRLRTGGKVAVCVVLPLLAYAALVAMARRSGAATVMMGAVAGSSTGALLTMALALALRLYTVVVLPGVVVYAIVARALAWRPRPTKD